MQHLIRKVFTVKLVIPKRFLWFKWNKHVSLEIKQATIAETLAYFEGVKNPSDIHFFLVAILEHFRGKKFRKSERKYLIAQQKTIIEILEKTYLYGVENKETKVPSKGEGVAGGPYSSFLMNVASSTQTPIQQIINEFTYEQVREISNGMTRNANNITDEGRNLNKGRARQKEFREKNDEEEIRRLLKE